MKFPFFEGTIAICCELQGGRDYADDAFVDLPTQIGIQFFVTNDITALKYF